MSPCTRVRMTILAECQAVFSFSFFVCVCLLIFFLAWTKECRVLVQRITTYVRTACRPVTTWPEGRVRIGNGSGHQGHTHLSCLAMFMAIVGDMEHALNGQHRGEFKTTK